jgi:uncharacterized membrane protein
MEHSPMKAIVAYLAGGVVMFVLDAIWLSSMGAVYRQHLGSVLLDGFRPVPAALFYLLYVAGIVILAVMPALREGGDWKMAAFYGAVLGLIAYGTYDLTNYATMKVWSPRITIMDMAWGVVLTALSSTAAFLAVRRFLP